jgi:hypothetical protein
LLAGGQPKRTGKDCYEELFHRLPVSSGTS